MKESLNTIIHTLSPSEKRYFKAHASRHSNQGEGQILKLFNLIEGNPDKTDAELIASLDGNALAKQFSVHKTLLHQALDRALREYDFEKTPGMKIRSLLDKIEIWFRRGKRTEAMHSWKKANTYARNLSLTNYMPEINTWERTLLRQNNPMEYFRELERLDHEDKYWEEQLAKEKKAIALYDRLFAMVQRDRRQEKESNMEEMELVSAEIADLDSETFGGQAALWNAKALVAQMRGNYQEMFDAYAELWKHWEAAKPIAKAEPLRFLRVQIAWLNSALAAGKLSEHLDQIRQMRKSVTGKTAEEVRLLFQTYNLELLFWMDKKEWDSALNVLAEMEEKIPTWKAQIGMVHQHAFLLNGAILFFRVKAYQRVVKWLHGLQQESSQVRNSTLMRNGQVLFCLAHILLGNADVAESIIQSMQTQFRQEHFEWKFGKWVVQQMKMLMRAIGTQEWKATCEQFNQILQNYRAEIPKGQPVPMMLDLLKDWSEDPD